MKMTMNKTIALGLLAGALLIQPATSGAQTSASTNAPAVTEPTPIQTTNAPAKKHKKHDHSVFNGKLSAIDTNGMTLTVGERTFEITSATKITKDARPATLADGVVGEMVGGAYKKGADGKLTATSISFGGKSEGTKKKKKALVESSGSSTNSLPN